MKNTILLILFLGVGLSTSFAQNTEKKDMHDEHFASMMSAYLETTEALYSDNFEKAHAAVEKLKAEVMNGNDHHKMTMEKDMKMMKEKKKDMKSMKDMKDVKKIKEDKDTKEIKEDMDHAGKHGTMLAAVTKASVAKDIKGIRAEFIAISNHLIESAKSHGYDETLFVQFCPMADSNKGAYWLSKSKDILNPYFGSMMLKCGSVKDTIEKKS